MKWPRTDWQSTVDRLCDGETVLVLFNGQNHVDGIRGSLWAAAKKRGHTQTTVHHRGVGLAVTWHQKEQEGWEE